MTVDSGDPAARAAMTVDSGDPVPRPDVSVVVCTRNHQEWLRECLGSIVADTSRARRELIVVDNGSTDGTADAVREFATACAHPVRLVVEEQPGQSRARNAGVRASRGSILIFTDDDVLVEDGWIDAVVAGFGDGVGAVGGRIVADFLSPPPEWMNGPQLDNAALIDYGTEPFEMADRRFPLGANMAVRRDLVVVLDQPFDERLGHAGDLAMGYEDLHLCKWLGNDNRIVYVPGAVVRHQVRGNRLEYGQVRKRYFQLGFGMARHERLAGMPSIDLARRCVQAPRTYARAVKMRRRNARSPSVSPTEAHEEFFGFMWAGKHLEMLFGRYPALANELARRLA